MFSPQLIASENLEMLVKGEWFSNTKGGEEGGGGVQTTFSLPFLVVKIIVRNFRVIEDVYYSPSHAVEIEWLKQTNY